MTWVAWRQHRADIIGLAIVFGGASLVLLAMSSAGMTAKELAYLPMEGGVIYRPSIFYLDEAVVRLLPPLVGMFLGAPMLAREWEHRTLGFAWTQAVSRGLWLRTKVLLLAGCVVLTSTVYAAAYMTWYERGVFPGGAFTHFEQGLLALPASCLFSFTLGVLAGVLAKRTTVAMVTTMIGSLGVTAVLGIFVRQHYLPPLAMSELDVDGASHRGDKWLVDIVTSRPHPSGGWTGQFLYHPADRFWTFQFIEAGIYVGLAAACVAAAFWWLQRKPG